MVLDDIFERFARQSPVTVMVRAALEHALSPRTIDALFEQTAQRQYTRTLLFSSVVDLMATVVCKVRPAINAAYRAKAEALGVSLRAVYDKLDRTEPNISAELVRHTARTLGPVITSMGGERVAWLPGYRVKVLDGNHLAGTQHRLKELRTVGAGGEIDRTETFIRRRDELLLLVRVRIAAPDGSILRAEDGAPDKIRRLFRHEQVARQTGSHLAHLACTGQVCADLRGPPAGTDQRGE